MCRYDLKVSHPPFNMAYRAKIHSMLGDREDLLLFMFRIH